MRPWLKSNEWHGWEWSTRRRKTLSSSRCFPLPRFIAATEMPSVETREPAGKGGAGLHYHPVKGLITEGLAWDAGTASRFFVSSVRRHAVFVVDPDKRISRFVDLPLGAFGMAVDNKRKVLWVAASSLPQVEGFTADQSDRAALMEVDLRTGRILRTFPAPAGKHLIGDVTVAANGDVYATDSSTPAIYKLRGETLEAWRSGPPFIALQGLVFSAGDRLLYVADYSKGIYAVDTTTGDTAALTLPADVTLLGVDGIYRARPANCPISMQEWYESESHHPHRPLLGWTLRRRVTTLAANREPMEDPTLGVMVGDQFYFNGAGQWELFGDDGKVTDEKALHEGVVMRVPVR